MNYIITLSDGSQDRVSANQVGITPIGALMLGDTPENFKRVYAPGHWLKIEASPISVVSN